VRQSIVRAWWSALSAVGLTQPRWRALPPGRRRAIKTAAWLAILLVLIALFGVWKIAALAIAAVVALLVVPAWNRIPGGKFVLPVAVLGIFICYP